MTRVAIESSAANLRPATLPLVRPRPNPARSNTSLRAEGFTALASAPTRSLVESTGQWLEEDPVAFAPGDATLAAT